MLRSSVNRFCYAMFYAVLALLGLEKRETSKHGGAISLFDAEFVKKDLFGREFSRWLQEAFDLRQLSDYAAGHRSRQRRERLYQSTHIFGKSGGCLKKSSNDFLRLVLLLLLRKFYIGCFSEHNSFMSLQ